MGRCGEITHLLGDRVLLHERLARVMEHERVVGREGDVEAHGEELVEWVLAQLEEEGVVREGREREAHLREVVQVLQRGRLAQADAVVNAAGGEEGGVKVVELPSLPRVRPEIKGCEALCAAQLVEHMQVGVEVVAVVRVVRILLGPLLRVHGGHLGRGQGALCLGLVVDAIKANDLLQEEMELRVRVRVDCHLEKGRKEVVEHLGERAQQTVGLVHAVEPRHLRMIHRLRDERGKVRSAAKATQGGPRDKGHLDEPSIVRRVQPMVDDPRRKLIPLGALATIDGDPVLGLLIL